MAMPSTVGENNYIHSCTCILRQTTACWPIFLLKEGFEEAKGFLCVVSVIWYKSFSCNCFEQTWEVHWRAVQNINQACAHGDLSQTGGGWLILQVHCLVSTWLRAMSCLLHCSELQKVLDTKAGDGNGLILGQSWARCTGGLTQPPWEVSSAASFSSQGFGWPPAVEPVQTYWDVWLWWQNHIWTVHKSLLVQELHMAF